MNSSKSGSNRVLIGRNATSLGACWLIAIVATSFASPADGAAIYESRYVEIGGIEQWTQIRGQDETNPVLLWLNGGPGGSTIPDTPAYAAWEEHFTVVMWDQRGEGKTFEKYGRSLAQTMTIERMSEDGIELAEYLNARLPEAKIILLGHSWGSILGIHMIRRRPALFAAYVGTGQVTSLPRQFAAAYPLLLERAADLGNEGARQELLSVGPPSASNTRAYGVVNRWGDRLDPPSQALPASSGNAPTSSGSQPAKDRPSYLEEGRQFSSEVLGQYLPRVDLPALGTDFEVPVFFFQGGLDLITTTSLVRDYYEDISAPAKEFVTFPNGGHLAIFRVRSGFLDELVERVKPHAVP